MSNPRIRVSIFRISEWDVDKDESVGLMLNQSCQGQDRGGVGQVAV